MPGVQHLPEGTKKLISYNDSILLSRSLETKIAGNIFGINLDCRAIFISSGLILTRKIWTRESTNKLPYSFDSLSKY